MEPLSISSDGRRILKADGTPFFYLGDTAWELFHRLTREEADHYLSVRAEQKFTVIQAVVLAEFDGLRTPNAYGHLPLHECDSGRPNEAYFEHVDWVIRRGISKGLRWGLLPTWGDKWNLAWGKGPEIFSGDTARAYGRWLGSRYRDIPLIWILGGDRPIDQPHHLPLIRAMAEGLASGDGASHLRTFHPNGGRTSAEWLHNEPWLDFNTLQSGHTSERLDNHRHIAADYARDPAKPCLDSEPVYENHPDIAFGNEPQAPFFNDLPVRRAAWQAVFAGACGHTYGCHDIWQFHGEKYPPVNRARTPWQQALHLPGANQMRHLRNFIDRLPFTSLMPDAWMVSASLLPSGEPLHALRTENHSLMAFYFPTSGTRTVRTGAMPGTTIDGYWFDPCSGHETSIAPFPVLPVTEWTPPAGGAVDRVLVLRSR